jgi:4,5:9,10-diseco-3-hydroxy-5,9,17-trioxoandrosta-1(10),2-diene-4-oate hydrolase
MSAQAGATVKGGHVAVGDIKLYYEEYGEGSPLVCLHGGGPGADSRSNFRTNVEFLAQRHRVLLVDLPQFGRSDKPVLNDNPLSYFSHHVHGLLQELGIPSAHFIGNSLGGQTAIKLAIDHPESVDRLVVIGSNPVARSLFNPLPVEGVKRISEYYTGDGPSREKMRVLLETFVYDTAFLTDELVDERYGASVQEDILALKRHPAPRRQDLSAELTRVTCPTLIVWGLEDRAGPLDVGLQMARAFADAEMHIFSRTGHWAQVERTDEFNRVVGEFLSRGPAA